MKITLSKLKNLVNKIENINNRIYDLRQKLVTKKDVIEAENKYIFYKKRFYKVAHCNHKIEIETVNATSDVDGSDTTYEQEICKKCNSSRTCGKFTPIDTDTYDLEDTKEHLFTMRMMFNTRSIYLQKIKNLKEIKELELLSLN